MSVELGNALNKLKGGSFVTERGETRFWNSSLIKTLYDDLIPHIADQTAGWNVMKKYSTMITPSYQRKIIQLFGGVVPPDPPAVGDFYEGGIIAIIESDHYVILYADNDVDRNYKIIDEPWGCNGIIIGASNPNDGFDNTALMGAALCNTTAIGATDPGTIVNGYNDWYIGSYQELINVFTALPEVDMGSAYWSSTESDEVYSYHIQHNGVWETVLVDKTFDLTLTVLRKHYF